MTKKICKVHGELQKSEIKSGIYRGKKYRKCKYCELERSRKYHTEKYNDPEWVKQKHAKDKKRWDEKKEQITEKRQTPESLQKRRDAYKKLAPRYREKCNKKQKEYRDTLHDHYVKKTIQNGDKSIKFDSIPESMVNLKRSLMMLRRGIKNKQISNIGEKKNEDKKY